MRNVTLKYTHQSNGTIKDQTSHAVTCKGGESKVLHSKRNAWDPTLAHINCAWPMGPAAQLLFSIQRL